MNSNSPSNISSNRHYIKHASPEEIKARLFCLNQNQLAKEWGVDRSSVSRLVAGQRLWSPLMKKLARAIKVSEVQLRTFFVENKPPTPLLTPTHADERVETASAA